MGRYPRSLPHGIPSLWDPAASRTETTTTVNPPDVRTLSVRRRDARWQRLGEQVVVLDRTTNQAHSLDGVTAAVWEVADERIDSIELCDAVCAQLQREVTGDELDDAISTLHRAGLLDVTTSVDARTVDARTVDRRRLLRLGVGAAVGGAALVTIGLPTPAAALSTGGPAPEFLNTSGYALVSDDPAGDGSTTPIIQSLRFVFTGTGTTPDVGYITINPNLHEVPPIVWSLPAVDYIPLTDYISMLDVPDYDYWMAATSVRVWFYDTAQDPDLFLGQAYFTSGA